MGPCLSMLPAGKPAPEGPYEMQSEESRKWLDSKAPLGETGGCSGDPEPYSKQRPKHFTGQSNTKIISKFALGASGEAHFTLSNPADIALLIGCGPVTAIPLILFAMGAKLLRYSTIGIMQYTAPTMIFLIAVFVFKEPFGGVKAVAFALIWAALALYSWSMLRDARRAKK